MKEGRGWIVTGKRSIPHEEMVRIKELWGEGVWLPRAGFKRKV